MKLYAFCVGFLICPVLFGTVAIILKPLFKEPLVYQPFIFCGLAVFVGVLAITFSIIWIISKMG